jgi:hypothetical protein
MQGAKDLIIHNWRDPVDILLVELGTQPVTYAGHIGSHGDDVGGSRVRAEPEPVQTMHNIRSSHCNSWSGRSMVSINWRSLCVTRMMDSPRT